MTYYYNKLSKLHLFVEFARQQVQPTLYSYNVLRVATKDFHPHNKLGQGGFGVVYKGILSDSTTVAVKHLTKSQQGVDDFLNEVMVITGVRHRNLVKLKGCCVHGTQRFLVFEYMENNNLAEALWGMLICNYDFLILIKCKILLIKFKKFIESNFMSSSSHINEGSNILCL
jgi:serine/threonine protein kinase